MPQVAIVRKRWRPSIAMVVTGVCITLISVPLLALLAVRLTSNQFVRETEQSLIQQSAIYAEIYADAFRALPGDPIGELLSEERRDHWSANLHPARATLNVRINEVLPPRPDGKRIEDPLDPRYAAIIGNLVNIARQARQATLSGVAFLTHDGRFLNEAGAPSLADLTEVQTALSGTIGRTLRQRGDSFEAHPLATISRDTGFRVFVTYPVIVEDRVVGVVYMSRTPLNLGKFLYEERGAILTMLAAMIMAACVIGWVLVRLISTPVKGLRDEAIAIAQGKKHNTAFLAHYGFRELATLGQSVADMAATLTKRSQEITTYTDHVTHELKSPVTTIVGASELLREGNLSDADRDKLLENIAQEGQRMNALLESLRDLTRLRSVVVDKAGHLSEMVPQISGLDIQIEEATDAQIPLTQEHGRIILLHMAQNSRAHDAKTLRINWNGQRLELADDGTGIDVDDIERLTEPFFTTRRETGGTGMGLAICEAILAGYGATLTAVPKNNGAMFVIDFDTLAP